MLLFDHFIVSLKWKEQHYDTKLLHKASYQSTLLSFDIPSQIKNYPLDSPSYILIWVEFYISSVLDPLIQGGVITVPKVLWVVNIFFVWYIHYLRKSLWIYENITKIVPRHIFKFLLGLLLHSKALPTPLLHVYCRKYWKTNYP